MTREDILEMHRSGNLSNPLSRELDFLLRRVGSESDNERTSETSETSETARSMEEDGVEQEKPLSLAERRLQQLYIFRERKQEADVSDVSLGDGLQARDLVEFGTGKQNWLSIGPSGVEQGQAGGSPVVSGRIKGIAIAPGGQRIYIAAANGGVWLSTNAGRNWLSLMDNRNYFPSEINQLSGKADSLSCGAIALSVGTGTNNGDKIYVGTGEGSFNLDAYGGVGVLVSKDGGMSWQREDTDQSAGSTQPTLIGTGFNALAIDPDDSERVLGATRNGLFVRESVDGRPYQWRQQPDFNGRSVWSVVVAKGAGGKRFFAFVDNGKVYSSDNGTAWAEMTDSFPTLRVGRTTLAVQSGNPNVVYAMVATSGAPVGTASPSNPQAGHLEGIYRLDWATDKKWYKITGKTNAHKGLLERVFGNNPAVTEGQGWYDNTLCVAPDNINRLYVGGSYAGNGAGIYRLDLNVKRTAVEATVASIGETAHPDVHVLTFTPDQPKQLWVGCDGGIFCMNDATVNGQVFESRNLGLQTMTYNNIGLYAKEEEYLFAAAQDNGCQRYFGDDVWSLSYSGDSGSCIVNWAQPNLVMATYTHGAIRKSTLGGDRTGGGGYDEHPCNVPIITVKNAAGTAALEQPAFYAPLVGLPYKDGLDVDVSKANFAAFGSQRVWITTDFGDNWKPIPSLSTDNTATVFNEDRSKVGGSTVLSLAFASPAILFVGTVRGTVHQFEDKSAANNWADKTKIVATDLNTASVGFGLLGSVTGFAVVPNQTDKFYVTLGGSAAGTRRVWYYDGAAATKWVNRSTGLIDINFNTIVVNPNNPSQVFVGSDVGVWKSENAGGTWVPFSLGLPETPVIDLKIFNANGLVLLRASTHGRGLYECNLSEATTPDVKLYFRANVLDRGRYAINLNKRDPHQANPSVKIDKIDTLDIKIDIPDPVTGDYTIKEYEKDALSAGRFKVVNFTDNAIKIPVPITGDATTHIYVQVNSRGILPANNVHVLLLIAKLAGGAYPDLPTDYDEDLKAGRLINTNTWTTIGLKRAQGVKAGSPKVVRFDLSSSQLGDKTTIANDQKFVLVALMHHPSDVFNSKLVTIGSVAGAGNVILSNERKVMYKEIAVKKPANAPPSVSAPTYRPLAGFVTIPETATAAEAPLDAFLGMAYRLNDDLIHKALVSRLAQPFSNRGVDNPTSAALDARSFYLADTLLLDKDIDVSPSTPLFWCARKKITLSKKINAKGKGAATGEGDFGGGGGGGAVGGKNCNLPLVMPQIQTVAGGASPNVVGADADLNWSSRALMMLTFCTGGAAGGDGNGGDKGGLGGGVVVLCAPVIEFTADGMIDASGALGNGSAGGGGGGIIILIAGEIIELQESKTNVDGGASAGTGGKGGKGFLLIKKFSIPVV